jgi:NAD(P)H-dependent FMN reductase
MRIIGIAGSWRTRSYNSALLRAAAEVTPKEMQVEIASIADFPIYDGDLESEHGIPAPVTRVKEAIAAADGLLLATPEYNNSIPGVLKNAIDWLTRPPKDIPRVFGDKPVAIMGATPGAGGTRFAQAAWLPVMRTLKTRIFTASSMYLAHAGQAFDDQGMLIDEKTKKILTDYMAQLASFVGASAR